ncbi:cytochrome P450 [Actinoplanes sp. KI2]|uniref:cytochrome P450 family protein n=1 Tax=Actinoplanes sp. KI2 TaxID=2983315 RepID=UPI0021D59930|nr:cytochrome P450 [Actinoplanes sp. KI2]MCU7729694.1 cytochrome P450 [Actinoplanes sp. KI2]
MDTQNEPLTLTDDAAFMAHPIPAYSAWREASTVHRTHTPDGAPVWLVTRYDDVRAALSDRRLSLNKALATTGYRGFSLPPALDANLLNLDPPDHTRLRRLVAKAFTARRVDAMRPQIQRVTDRLLDQAVPHDGTLDLIRVLAAPLPMIVIGDLLGVPPERREVFRTWTNTLLAPSAGSPFTPAEALGHLEDFLRELIAGHRDVPDDTLLSDLVGVRDGGDALTEDELTSLAFLLLWAGYETTVHLIGNGLLTLLRHPDQMDRLRRDPGLLPASVEEVMRFAGPNPYAIRRFAREDLDLAGVRIPAGDTVLLLLAAAHRDPRRVTSPDDFDIAREDNPHLGFGYGIHHCLGAPLARLEAQIAIGTVLSRFRRIRLAVPVDSLRWQPSFRSRGLLSLPVVISPVQADE